MGRSLLFLAVCVGIVVAPAAGTSRPQSRATSSFTPAAHRHPPIVPNAGGAGKPLRIISLVPTSYPNATSLVAFGNVLASTTWLADVDKAWHIPPGAASHSFAVTGMPTLTAGSHSVGEYQAYIGKLLQQEGVPAAPSYQTIYVLYVPCTAPNGMDSFGCTSHHPPLQPSRPVGLPPAAPVFAKGDSIAAVLGAQSKPLDSNTTIASHETAEAATNTPGVGQWALHTHHANAPYLDAPPWIRATGTIEVADLAGGTAWRERTSQGKFQFQRIYSNAASSANGDPDVPPSGRPYYSVSTAKDWYRFPGAAHANVPVAGWSAAAIPAWKLTAQVEAWRGKKSGKADPCSLPTTSWSIGNSGTVHVKVDVSHPHAGRSWCTLMLKSAAAPSSVPGDTSHFWNVGLIIRG